MRKAVLHLSQSDPVMRAIIKRVGPCRMEYGEPEFHSLAASECAAHRRFRRAYGNEEVLQEAQAAQAGSDGEDRESVGAVSLRRVLVFVEESRRENDVRHR